VRHTTALARRRDDWVAAVNARSLSGYGSVLTEGAVWMPPGAAAIDGRSAILEWLRPFFSRYEYAFTLRATQVRVAGAWALEHGVFRTRIRPSGTAEAWHEHAGRYVVFWRQDDVGAWRSGRRGGRQVRWRTRAPR
jgi:ketosteroid isomerase-like protein